ncbi:MAG: hypothetical protein ACRDHZ_20735 [Ktedonobacteraceae bacterium]
MKFSELIGREILILIPKIHQVELQKVNLVGVEAGGIWIESQAAMIVILRTFKQSSSPKTLVFFFPYHEITFAMVGIDKLALDEKAFGV